MRKHVSQETLIRVLGVAKRYWEATRQFKAQPSDWRNLISNPLREKMEFARLELFDELAKLYPEQTAETANAPTIEADTGQMGLFLPRRRKAGTVQEQDLLSAFEQVLNE